VDSASAENSLPAPFKKNAIVKVYEPWVGQDIFPKCKTYFAQLSWSKPGTNDPGGCVDFVSDLVQPPMDIVVKSISDRLDRDLAGIATFSFGATRTREIWPLLKSGGNLLVVQPAPTPNMGVDPMIEMRAEAAWSVLARVRNQACTGEVRCDTIDQVRTRLGSPEVDARWSTSGTEMSLFTVGAVANVEKYRPFFTKLFSGAYSSKERSDIRRVAMSVTHTLDPDTALASNVGYRAAMCQAYGPPNRRTLTTDPLELALRAQLGPCGEHSNGYASSPKRPPTTACLLTTKNDPAIPPTLLNTNSAFKKNQSLSYDSDIHEWPSDEVSRITFTSTGPRSCSTESS
jgi:hypothetical protein